MFTLEELNELLKFLDRAPAQGIQENSNYQYLVSKIVSLKTELETPPEEETEED